jgi:hypothetical protein
MAATREAVIIPGPADHLPVFAKHRRVEQYELDRLKSLRAAALALRAPGPVDHLASGIPGDQDNCPGPPREHLACHSLCPRSMCWIVRPNISLSPDTYTVCYLAFRFRIDHLSGHNCSSRFTRGKLQSGAGGNFRGFDIDRGTSAICGSRESGDSGSQHDSRVEQFLRTPDAEDDMLALRREDVHKSGEIVIVDGKSLRDNEPAAYSHPETSLERVRPAREYRVVAKIRFLLIPRARP